MVFMMLQKKLKQLNDGFAKLSVPFSHYRRPRKEPPFGVWAEDGEDSALHANNSKYEQFISGTADYFTKVEFDPVVDEVQVMLNDLEISWSLNSVQYEANTGLIHYEWTWTVI